MNGYKDRIHELINGFWYDKFKAQTLLASRFVPQKIGLNLKVINGRTLNKNTKKQLAIVTLKGA